jgi:predicted phage baseplate assembly protein
VDGVEWQEAPSFYGQPPNATVFVTYEDDQNMTHVQFGDGVYGSRLPSGVNNVVATYRYGSGSGAPDVNTLSVILKSWPGLKGIVNPVAAGGGADPDPPDQIKTYAPQSVLTFGRAISADDYEAIAAEAPGVARARAYWSWDAMQDRMMVKIYVGDDATAVADAQTALANAGDPNRPVNVLPAAAVPVTLSLTVIVDPTYVLANVSAAVTTALIDANQGLLGANSIGIGAGVWQSQIYQACQGVKGVIAVHNLQFAKKEGSLPFVFRKPIFRLPIFGKFVPFQPQCTCQDVRLDPGEGGYLQLAAADFNPTWEVAPNAG